MTENDGKAPEAVPYMPPGEHTIAATRDGEPQRLTVIVDADACARLQADLEQQQAAFENGEKARPVLMFDHNKSGNAAATPIAFEWDAERGILLRVEWTQAGREAIEGGNYGYISPAFRADDNGIILGLTGGVEVGSLVNDPAFEKNACILASKAELPPLAEVEKTDKMRDNPIDAESVENKTDKKTMDEIKKALGLPPEADDAAILDAIKALQEAGNKNARDVIAASNRAYVGVVQLVIELIRQFYSEARTFRITGENGHQYVQYDNSGILSQAVLEEDGTAFMRKPVFDIAVRARVANPLSREAANELAMLLYDKGAFSPEQREQTLILLEMMDFEGIGRIKQMVENGGAV